MKKISNLIIEGDALKVLKDMAPESVNMVMTSPPYWALRDYGMEGQLGMEKNFMEYINKLCDIFDEVKRVLKNDGVCFVNIGDTYSTTRWSNNPGKSGRKNRTETPLMNKETSLQKKSLCQIPSRFAIEMSNRGWILRNEIIWFKPNCMPSSATDRFTIDFEKVFFFSKSEKYYFKTPIEPATYTDSRKDKGLIKYKNRLTQTFVKIMDHRTVRTVWKIPTKAFKGAHFAVYPEELCRVPIDSGCPKGGIVLDPFMGAGTTLKVAKDLGCQGIGIELNPAYIKIAKDRLK